MYCNAWKVTVAELAFSEFERTHRVRTYTKTLSNEIGLLVGGVAQWLERRSLAGDFPCPALDLQLMDDH